MSTIAIGRFFHDVWAVAADRLRAQLRVKVWVAMEVIEPIMWLILYTQLYTDQVTKSFLGTRTYLDFFVPGLLVMGSFFSASWCGLALLDRLRSGFINRLLVSPISRTAIVLGYSVALIVSIWWQVSVVMITAVVMGWRPPMTFEFFAVIFVVITFIGLAFSSLSFALTFVGQHEDAIIPVLNFVQLPMLFLSGIFLPLSVSPVWVQWAAKFNPLGWAHQALSSSDSIAISPAASWITLLILFALAANWLARKTVRPM